MSAATQLILLPVTDAALHEMHDLAAYSVASATKCGFHLPYAAPHWREHFARQVEQFRATDDAVHQRINLSLYGSVTR